MKKLKLQNKILFGLVGVLSLVAVANFVRAGSEFSWDRVESKVAEMLFGQLQGGNLGGTLSSEPTNLTASDDWQAVNSLYEYGDLEVDGTTYLDGGLSAASTTIGGASTTIAILVPTTTITAAQICDSSFININASSTGLSPVNDIVFAGTSTMFSACLNAVGKSHTFLMLNASTTEGASLIYSGAGNVLIASPSSTAADADSWSGADYRRVTFTRVSNNTSTVEMYSLRDAD